MYVCVCVCDGGGGGRGGGGRRLSKLYGIPILTLIFHSGKNIKKNIFVRSVWRSSNSSINHYGQKQIADKAYNGAQQIIFCMRKLLCFDSQVL